MKHALRSPLYKPVDEISTSCSKDVRTCGRSPSRSPTELSQLQRELWLSYKNLKKLAPNFNVKVTIHTLKG